MNYYNRLVNELEDLTEKTLKLQSFLTTEKYRRLAEQKQRLLALQFSAMATYSMLLTMRIEIADGEKEKDNIDRPEKHNIAGSMNKPSRDQEWQDG